MTNSINVLTAEEAPSISELSSPPSKFLPDVAQPQSLQSTEESKPVFEPARSFILAFISICIVTLAAALDATSLSIALPIVTERLKGTAIEAFWSGTSFLVTSAVFQPVIGGLSHIFGRKQLVLVSAFFFALGSLVAALATHFTMMLIGRSIQGIGGGGILTLGEILITDLVPLSDRGTWFGYMSGMWAIGTVAGPLMGGGFAQSSHSGWSWIFWINLPIIGVGAIAVILFLKVDRLKGEIIAKIQRFDWFGSAFFIGSTISFLIPITSGGVMFAWDSWHTLLPLFIGAVGIGAFGFYEYKLSAKTVDSEGILLPDNNIQPIIRFSIFRNRTLRLVYLQTLVHGIVLWSLLYFLPLYYEGVKEYKPIIAGVAVLPETFIVAPMSIAVGIVSSKTGRYRWAIWISWGITTLGFGILFILNPDTSVAAFIFINIPVAIGTGMAFNSMSLAIQAAGRPQDAGHSVTFYSFIRVFGQSLGVAIGGVVFQNQIHKELSKYSLLAPLAGEYSKDATMVISIIQGMDAGIKKTQLVQAYADSIKMIWVVMAALSGTAFISSVFVKGYSLEQEHTTLHSFNPGEREKKQKNERLDA